MSSPPCAGHTQAIDTFVTESTDTLSARPESMEEIGAANAKCSHIVSRKSEVRRAPLGERPGRNVLSFSLSVEHALPLLLCVTVQILPHFTCAEEKNRLLRAVAGSGLDSLSSLRAKWDKLELVVESHQLMIKEQVGGEDDTQM